MKPDRLVRLAAVACIVAALLALAELAEPAGPTVGRNCVASWTAPTTHTDGTPLTGALTYNLYIAGGTPTEPPTIVTVPGVGALSANICTNLQPGQYTLWVTAVETLAGSSSESAKTPAYPFVFILPSIPTSVNVR
jgi:hypothetical protein